MSLAALDLPPQSHDFIAAESRQQTTDGLMCKAIVRLANKLAAVREELEELKQTPKRGRPKKADDDAD